MMSFITLILLIAPVAAIFAQRTGDPPSRHTYPVLRLKPTAFPELPKSLVAELERRGCTIPQPYTNRRANVIRGQFAQPGQTDWAVLCSSQGFSSILVFWNAAERNPAEIAKWPEPDSTVIYDHFIKSVGRKFIMDHYRTYGGPKPPPIDHQGIESGGEKASGVLYYYRGKWLKLQGAD
jgi:hypothetical protein